MVSAVPITNLNDLIERDIVFISTKGNKEPDKTECLKLCEQLNENGIKYWCMYKNNIGLDDGNWQEDVAKTLPRAIVLIVLISKNVFSGGSEELSREISNEVCQFRRMMETDSSLSVMPIQLFDGNHVIVTRDGDNEATYTHMQILRDSLGLSNTGTRFYKIENSVLEIKKRLKKYSEQSIVKYINKQEQRSVFLKLQNYCLQKKCQSSKVSDYILNSREIAPALTTSELHIVTNEFYHYDFTALATLAISENIRSGRAKYIYYYPAGTARRDFGLLKNKVTSFLRRDDNAVIGFDMWLRARLNEAHQLVAFLENEFYGPSINHIMSRFDFRDETLEQQFGNVISKIPYQDRGNICEYKVLTNWLKAREQISEGDFGNLTKYIDIFREIIKVIDAAENQGVITFKDRFAASLVKKFKRIIYLFDFSTWFTRETENSDYKKVLDKLFDDRDVPYISETRAWVERGNGVAAGAKIDDEGELSPDEIIDKNLIGIEIPDNTFLDMCYSFCLYVSADERPRVAWYDCDSDTDDNKTDIDENIFVFAPDVPRADDEREFKNAYKTLILQIPGAKDILESKGCKYILDVLNIRGEV